MAHYLVTGQKGFIGKNLWSRLISLGHKLEGLEIKNVQQENWKERIQIIFDKQQIDGIFHVGACADTLEQNVNYMMFLNFEITRYLADIATEMGIKLVYSSSAANYGIDERELPANLYAWSKYCGEQYIKSSGCGVSLRYFNVFGPGEEHKDRMASVAYQAYKGFYLTKEISGMKLFPFNPKRDFIHVFDVVEANILAMENYLPGHVFDVGTTDPVQFELFMDIFKIPYYYSSPEEIPNGYQFYTRANPEKLVPGWQPKSEIKQRIIDYKNYLDNGKSKI